MPSGGKGSIVSAIKKGGLRVKKDAREPKTFSRIDVDEERKESVGGEKEKEAGGGALVKTLPRNRSLDQAKFDQIPKRGSQVFFFFFFWLLFFSFLLFL